MSNFEPLIQDLAIANRILAREEVVDAYGHVSVRHPDNPNRFLIARSLAPELVGPEDIVELELEGQPARDEDRSLYLERFIHAAIFAARPDVMAVVHAHAEDLQRCLSKHPLPARLWASWCHNRTSSPRSELALLDDPAIDRARPTLLSA
jgi:ribulose-5-phosphate 4-epimerase/fuculose-1-phosphate aldolase